MIKHRIEYTACFHTSIGAEDESIRIFTNRLIEQYADAHIVVKILECQDNIGTRLIIEWDGHISIKHIDIINAANGLFKPDWDV